MYSGNCVLVDGGCLKFKIKIYVELTFTLASYVYTKLSLMNCSIECILLFLLQVLAASLLLEWASLLELLL